MTARGLTPNQLRELRERYGSNEAIAAAYPEFADWLRASEEISRTAGWIADAFADAAADAATPTEVRLSIDPELELQREIRDELVALRRASEAPADGQNDLDIDPRSNPDEYDADVFWRAVVLLTADATLTAIAKETRLSPNKVRKIRDWHAHPGRFGPKDSPGYRLDPGESAGSLLLHKLRKPR